MNAGRGFCLELENFCGRVELMGGCISTMPRRLRSSRLRPSPQVHFPGSVKIQSNRTGNFFQRVPLCPPHYRDSSSGTTAPPVARPTRMRYAAHVKRRFIIAHIIKPPILTKLKLLCGDEKFWCPICLANPKGMAFGCGHQTCLECARDLQSCPKCGSVGTPMQLY